MDPDDVALEGLPVEAVVLVANAPGGLSKNGPSSSVIRNPSSTSVFGIRLPPGVALV